MKELAKKSDLGGSNLVGITACWFLAVLNAFTFAVSNGRIGHPTSQIGEWGIIGNTVAFSLAWFFFATGKRKGILQSVLAIGLLSMIHFLMISNVWTIIAHQVGPWALRR